MPENTHTTEQPKPTTAEVVASGPGQLEDRHTKHMEGSIRSAMERGQDRASRLREMTEGNIGRNVFAKNLEHGREIGLGNKGYDDIKSSFGAGQIEQKPDGSIVDHNSQDGRAVESYREAKSQVDRVESFLKYQEITTAVREGKDIDNVRHDKDISVTQWENMRRQATDEIINMPGFLDSVPGLRGMPEDELRDYVEQKILYDPKIAEKITAKMRKAHEDAKHLPKIEESQAIKDARSKEAGAREQIRFSATEIKRQLQERGVHDSESLKRIESALNNSAYSSTEGAMSIIQSEMIKSDSNLHALIEVQQLQENISRKQTELQEAQAGRGVLARLNPLQRDARASELTNEVKKLTTQREAAKQIVDNLSADQLADAKQKLVVINAITSGDKNEDGQFKSPLAHEVDLVTQGHHAILETRRTIATTKAEEDARQSAKLDERLQKEGELSGRIENIIHDSVAETMDERYDAYTKLLTEEQEEQKSQNSRYVESSMRNRWVQYDQENRQKIIHSDKIGEDMRTVIYSENRDEGTRRLMLRDIVEGRGTKLVDRNGQEVNWRSVDLRDLSDEDKTILEQAVSDNPDYMDKLFTDFYIARDGKSDVGLLHRPDQSLRLKQYEWQMLHDRFGADVEEGIKNSNEGKQILTNLENQGITKEKDKAAWMQAILAALGGLAIASATSVGSASKESIVKMRNAQTRMRRDT